jgi:DNA-binding transcriptional LysR family regulator
MDINLQKYLSFIKVVEYGSFTKAAEILNYTQSGISRMISDLEKEWGVSLLERGKGGVRLTGDGIKILPYARQLCTDFDRLRTQVDEINGLPVRSVFNVKDIPDYESHDYKDCPYCKRGRKLDALVNSHGYSWL